MKTIDRYVARNYLFSYLVVLAGFVGLYAIIDASMNLDEFIQFSQRTAPEAGAGARVLALLGNLGRWYLFRLPLFFHFLAPIITVAAAVVTVVMMKRRNEFTPLMASGISVYRGLWPVIALALLASGLAMANQELVLPRLADQLMRPPDDPLGEKAEGLGGGFTDDRKCRISASSFIPGTRTLKAVHVEGPAEDGGRLRILADEAVWDAAHQAWRLYAGHLDRFDTQDVLISRTEFGPGAALPDYLFETSLRPEEVHRFVKWLRLTTTADLTRLIAAKREEPRLRVELHSRYVVPLNAVILLLLGLPLVLMQESKSVIVGLGIALVICLTYLGVQFVSQQMGTTGRLSPIIAVWLPIFIFGPVSIILFDSIRT